MSKKVFDSKIILKQIGQRLRHMRKEKGFKSYEQFAFTHELNRVQYGYYEQGKKDLRLSSLLKVLEAHETSLDEFFADMLNVPPSKEKLDQPKERKTFRKKTKE